MTLETFNAGTVTRIGTILGAVLVLKGSRSKLKAKLKGVVKMKTDFVWCYDCKEIYHVSKLRARNGKSICKNLGCPSCNIFPVDRAEIHELSFIGNKWVDGDESIAWKYRDKFF